MKNHKDKVIEILDTPIEVKFQEPDSWAEDGQGRCHFQKGQILIRDSMPQSIIRLVFLHELIHMICDIQGVELKEQDIDNIAVGMNSFLRNHDIDVILQEG